MTHKSLSFSDLHLSLHDVYRQMGYAGVSPSVEVMARTEDLVRRVAAVARPRFAFVTAYGSLLGHQLVSGDVTLRVGRMVARQLTGSEAFAFFVATAGMEVERLRGSLSSEGDTLGAFIVDAIGSVMAERCADQMEYTLQQSVHKLGWGHTNRFSPGYCHWPVSDQASLFRLLGDAPCGVTLNPQCLMSPVKSVSGVIGLGAGVRRLAYACQLCTMTGCRFRGR